jgi:cathepsin C
MLGYPFNYFKHKNMTETIKSKHNFNILFLMTLFLCLSITKCDLPVHCLLEDVVGKWMFRVSNEKFNPVLNDLKTSCGHKIPNNIDVPVGNSDFSFIKYSDFELELKADHKVYHDDREAGTWTLVYDQSMLLRFRKGDDVVIMTAPFKYYKTTQVGTPISDCSKTVVGWYVADEKNLKKEWSCYFGFKKDYLPNFLQIKERSNGPVLTQLTTNEIDFGKDIRYEHLEPFVNKVNEMNLSWKAHINKDFVGLSFLEIRQKLGLRRGLNKVQTVMQPQAMSSFIQIEEKEQTNSKVNKFLSDLKAELNTIKAKPSNDSMAVNVENDSIRDADSKKVNNYREISKYLNTDINNIDAKTLPKNWDWRNVGGNDYTTPIQNQGDCGSCYVFAAISSLESRLRIQTNLKDKTRFSKQFPIACNFYSEGCEGGYPILVGKFFSEFEIVPESCFPYSFNPSTPKCKEVCDYTRLPKKYTVSKYGYVGGAYGATSEVDMMKELRARGPIPGSIKVPVSFNYYKSGIFSLSALFKNNQNISKVTQLDRAVSWEKVEHSITIVGYGEEDGVKYWILQNTWGENWGEKGYFRLLRGENELSIESMGDILQLKIEDRRR